MAKKEKIDYKNVKINPEALASTQIGEISNDEKGPFVVLGFFLFLLIAAFFMPNIVNFINKKDKVIVDSDNSSNVTPGQDGASENLVFYDLNDNLTITLDSVLKIDKFKIKDNTINFRITNNGEVRYYFNRYNYFLELYNENNTLLERVILKKEGIARDNYKDYTYEIKAETASAVKKIVFTNIPIDGYPYVETVNNVLTCTKNYQTITYSFVEEKLTNIDDLVNVPNTDTKYQDNLNLYRSQVSQNQNIAGVNATLNELATGFIVSTSLNLKNVDITKLTSDNYYAVDTLAKVVSFEMNARGYTCK